MVIFHSYVSLPEGTYGYNMLQPCWKMVFKKPDPTEPLPHPGTMAMAPL